MQHTATPREKNAEPRRAPARMMRTPSSQPWTRLWEKPTFAVGAFLLAVLFVGYRTYRLVVVPGQPHAPGWGMQDFRDAIYYPVVAFLEGGNPYDASTYLASYPVGNSFPMYSPLQLLIHLPLGWLPFTTAELGYFLVTASLVVALAHLTLRLCGLDTGTSSVFALAALIVLSEPGQWNLYLGQSAATLAVATYGALYFARRRPWLAALGVALATLKPTWGIPLVLLMVARGDLAIVVRGLLIAAVLSALPAALVVRHAGGLGPFLMLVRDNYAHFAADPAVNPAASAYRVDVVALIGRLLGRPLAASAEIGVLLGILGVAAVGVRQLRTVAGEEAERLSAILISLALLICTYHQTYELLLVAAPLVAAAGSYLGPTAVARPWLRWIGVGALCVPAINYLVDGWTLARLDLSGGWWLGVTSLNGAALLVGFGTYLILVYGARATALALPECTGDNSDVGRAARG